MARNQHAVDRAVDFAKQLLQYYQELEGCDAVAFKFAIHAVAVQMGTEVLSTIRAHPEFEATWKRTVAEVMIRTPRVFDEHSCPECVHDHADDEGRGSRGK